MKKTNTEPLRKNVCRIEQRDIDSSVRDVGTPSDGSDADEDRFSSAAGANTHCSHVWFCSSPNPINTHWPLQQCLFAKKFTNEKCKV